MNLKLFQLLSFLLILSLTPFIVRSTSSLSSNSLLGISPQDEKYYNTASEFLKCKDGSKKFNRTQLNDDFCDCSDGSDEPGTSACPNGKFYCRNAGHMPTILFSSRVNDGICDCCDGSDEYDGKVKCQNTCWEAGKAARDKLKKKIATYEEGVNLRRKEVEQAKLGFAKDEAELDKLKKEEKVLKGLVQQLKEHKEQIDKAEEKERLEKERLEKEKEEKLKKDAEKETGHEKAQDEEKIDTMDEKHGDTTSHNDVIGTLDDSLEQDDVEVHSKTEHVEGSPHDAAEQVSKENYEELSVPSSSSSDHDKEQETSETENPEGLSKEELGRLVASRWTGEKTEHSTENSGDTKHIDHVDETIKDVNEEDYDGYSSEFDENDNKYDDHDEHNHNYDEHDDTDDHVDDFNADDHEDSSSYRSDSDDESLQSDVTISRPSWLEKIQSTVKSILQVVNFFQTPVNTTDAARIRKEYDDSNSKLTKIQSRISSLSYKLKLDFGPEKEFYSLYDRCFETKQNKYTYKVCPYKKATQEEGHMTTRLGQWEKFEDSYKAMLFSNGDRCWNGPDRSLKVKLRCGLKNEVTDVDEPSRCEYVALLSTPSVCVEEKLKELQDKLNALNQEQPPNHDEL